ncbi:MAG TPA: hypothetical protein PLU50_05380, partial [Pseudobdellovibrionaceae bacterium]|nr:hypothetical protein [Pseudobdellovibrionaceae bacterium]
MGSNHFIQKFRQSLRNQKGFSSLMLVTTAVIFITYLVIETTYDTRIEYEINANDISRIKAYYAAKAAVDFSLLRIRLYNSARTKFKSQLGAAAQKLDLIWSIPIPWPLVGLSGSDQNEIKKANKESLMDASFTSSITE